MQKIPEMIQDSIDTKKSLDENKISIIATKLIKALKNKNKILICGNGGSAADSQHIAAELVGRYKLERKGLAAIALTTDSSILTAWSNDYEYDTIFSRQVESLANKGDILLGISTSGNSKNIIRAFEAGGKIGTKNISLTGRNGGKLAKISEINLNISSNNTPRIQESHMLAYHIICEIIDEKFAK